MIPMLLFHGACQLTLPSPTLTSPLMIPTQIYGTSPYRTVTVRFCKLVVATIACGFLTGSLLAAPVVPLGSPAFQPAPERPVGWRGDGTGRYPGATPSV